MRLEDETGAVGWGEAAPIPEFGTETIEQAEEACQKLGESAGEKELTAVPARLVCLRSALGAALAEQKGQAAESDAFRGGITFRSLTPLPVAALLPAGRAALATAGPKAEAGFRTFKWKVGVGDLKDELALLDDLLATLPAGSRLRLDANGAWDRRAAERWLERCADYPVEFIEQPVARDRRGADDLLLGLAGDYPTPIALDESLVGVDDIRHWIGAGWRGIYVVKPALVGDPAEALGLLARARADVVFSSALETAVGARSALKSAFEWAALAARRPGSPLRALGFGVWPLFSDAHFDGPAAAPFFRWADVERINPEAVWTALS